MYKEYIWWHDDEQPKSYEYDDRGGLMLAYKQDIRRKGTRKILIVKKIDNVFEEWIPLLRYDRTKEEEYNANKNN